MASASRDSGLTMSNPELCGDETVSPVGDDQSTLERDGDRRQGTMTRNGKPVPSAMGSTGGILSKSMAISDDSVLGSPNEFSTENSEPDWEDGTLRRRHLTAGAVPMRFRSLDSGSPSPGLALAFYAQRPKSSEMDADDFLVGSAAVLGEQWGAGGGGASQPEAAVSNPDGPRRTLERSNAVDDLTPVNSWRRNQDARPDQDRIQPQNPSFRREVPSPIVTTATGREVVEANPRTSGRRSVDSMADNRNVAPNSYEEALLHRELLRNDLSEQDRQQIKNNLARKLYHKSLVMYATQNGPVQPSYGSGQPQNVSPARFVRSSPSPVVARRCVATEGVVPPPKGSPQTERATRARSGSLTVIVSPATAANQRQHDPGREKQPPPPPAARRSSPPGADGKRRFPRKYLTVVDVSSSSSERSVSPHARGCRRRVVRRRASDRYRHGGGAVTSGSKGVYRSRSDASDVTARVTDFHSDRSYPRANELVSLLVTGRPHDRRVIVNNSDARSVSSDSTYTGAKRAYTMKDRDWHRELVEQYREPTPNSHGTRSTTPTSRYHGNTRRSATVVILPTPRSHESVPPPAPSGRRSAASPQLYKPASIANLHQPGKQEFRTRDSSCPRYADPGRTSRPGSSSEKVREAPRIPCRLVASASPEARPERRPSLSTDCYHVRSAAHKPRPSIETRMTRDPISDLRNINWSVTKLRELYSGGAGPGAGSGAEPAASSANKTSSSGTTVKLDKNTESKPLLSRIGAVQRLL